MIFEIISGGEKLTGWGKNGPAYFFPGERMGRPILSPGKKLTGGKFRPVTPGPTRISSFHFSISLEPLQGQTENIVQTSTISEK